MTNSKPMLLVDIDGVLNAFDARGSTKGYARTQANGYRLTYRPEWAVWINKLSRLSDPIWATMWQENARSSFAPATGIGVGIKDHIDFRAHNRDGFGRRTGWGVGGFKHPGVVATVGDRPFCWIDDDLEPWQYDWALERTESGIPTLLVQPNSAVGLTAGHVRQIERFLLDASVLV